MATLYNISAPKKPTSLTINSDLLAKAKDLKINISSTLEFALIEQLKARKRDNWKEANREAIENYNEKVSEYGLFSDELRSF